MTDGLQQAWARQCRVWMPGHHGLGRQPKDISAAVAAYDDGATLAEAGKLCGLSGASLRERMVELGIPRRPRGRPKGLYDTDRAARIIAERERGDTYDAIGFRLGITRERVRQILHAVGRSDLCGPIKVEYVPLLKPCAYCSEKFEPRTDHSKFCSHKCHSAAMREEWERKNHSDAYRQLQETIIEYAAGTPWSRIAVKVFGIGEDRPQHWSQAQSRATRLAKRFGIIPPWRRAA